MQTKSVEPGAHSGIARYFGLVFLFQALASLCTAFSEQLYDNIFSLYFAVLAIVLVLLAVAVSIPAAVAVAVPEPNRTIAQAFIFVLSLVAIICTTLLMGPNVESVPEIPYVAKSIRADVLAATVAASFVMAAAAVIRMVRNMKGRNGAFILLAGLILAATFGVMWIYVEPICRRTEPENPWPTDCPMSSRFDHNTAMTVFIMISNILAAEGVLRLMAAGSGLEHYVDINFVPAV